MDKPVTLFVIDDIKSVVDGVASIEWEAHGIQLAGTATNGKDGLEQVGECRPDVILTDIRMPKMDGLEMVRRILGLDYPCKILLMTGFAEFEYGKQAVQLGAFDFITKPFSEEEIIRAVCKAAEQVKTERQQKSRVIEMEHRLRESMPALRQEYFMMLTRHQTSEAAAQARWDFLQIPLNIRQCAILLMEIDHFQEKSAAHSLHELELIRFSLQNIVEETLGLFTTGIVFREAESRFAAVINSASTADSVKVAEACCRHIAAYTRFTISIGVGDIAESIDELPRSYRQAQTAIAHHLYTEGNAVMSYQDTLNREVPLQLAGDLKEELMLALRSGNSSKVQQLLRSLAEQVEQLTPRPDPDYLLNLYDELAAMAVRTMYEKLSPAECSGLANEYKEAREKSKLAFAELQGHLERLFTGGAAMIHGTAISETASMIYRSLDYMNERLHEEVTLADCAAQVHLSVSYYTILFKKVTGQTFVQYLTQERIKRAKAMLIDGMPVQDVAASVGYEERRYFSDVFKKVTGMTPTAFRAQYFGEDGPEKQ